MRMLPLMVVCSLGAGGLAAMSAPAGVFHLTVSVAEGRGRVVAGLTASDFLVRLGDVDRLVGAVTPDPRSVAMVVAVDGLEAEEALHARAALTSVLGRLREAPGSRVGLMLGEGGARAPQIVDAVTEAGALSRRVSRFFRAEVTAPPQDLLAGAVEALATEEQHRRVVLLLSVNRRAGRVQIPVSLVNAVRRSAVTLVALEVATGVSGTRQDPALQLIHQSVGGVFERVPDVTALEAAAVRLTSAVLSAYLVTFSAEEPLAGSLTVRIRDRPRATVIAPNFAMRLQ